MPFVMALACFGMGLTLEEALVAATINAACSVNREDRVGSLEPGKQMDAVVVNGSRRRAPAPRGARRSARSSSAGAWCTLCES